MRPAPGRRRRAWESDADDARFVIAHAYLEPGPFSVVVERAGLGMTFDGNRFRWRATPGRLRRRAW